MVTSRRQKTQKNNASSIFNVFDFGGYKGEERLVDPKWYGGLCVCVHVWWSVFMLARPPFLETRGERSEEEFNAG